MQQFIDSYDFTGKKAIVRVDFNVPLDENFNITDDTRIRRAMPTLKKVLEKGGSVTHEISLPCYPQLNEEMTQFVIQTVINAYNTVVKA